MLLVQKPIDLNCFSLSPTVLRCRYVGLFLSRKKYKQKARAMRYEWLMRSESKLANALPCVPA